MTQIFRVTIGGTVVTNKVSGCNVSEVMNRFYNVAIFTYKEEISTEEDIVIEYGSSIFEGFVFSVEKTGHEAYSIECRTHSAKLTTPYSVQENTVDKAITSHALCALYATAQTPINITACDLDFGGDYNRSGTKLSALTAIANTTGAEYYVENNEIYIVPNKAITEDGLVIPKGDIFDFEPFSKSIDDSGVGVVIIDNNDEASEVVSESKIKVDVDSYTGAITAYIIPHDNTIATKGASDLKQVHLKQIIKKVVLDATYLELDMDIVSINSVTLDGQHISTTSVYNLLLLDTERSGILVVDYVGYVYTGFADIKQIGADRYIDFEIDYGDTNEQTYRYNAILSEKYYGDEDSATTDDVTIFTPQELDYVKGFDFYTIGDDAEVTFYEDGELSNLSAQSSSVTYDVIEAAYLSSYDGSPTEESTQYETRFPIVDVNDVRAAGVSIPYTVDGNTLLFDDYYSDVKVSYTTTATEWVVGFDNLPNTELSMLVSSTLGDSDPLEYLLDGTNFDDINDIPCGLPASVPVNIIELLGVSLYKCRGRSVTVSFPNGSTVNVVVNDMGIARVEADANGTYELDTSSIVKGSTIVLEVDTETE